MITFINIIKQRKVGTELERCNNKNYFKNIEYIFHWTTQLRLLRCTNITEGTGSW